MRRKSLHLLTTLFILLAFALTACDTGGADGGADDGSGGSEQTTDDGGDDAAADDGGDDAAADDSGDEVAMEETRGVFRFTHQLAFGNENLDPVDPSRFFPVISLVYDRLVQQDDNGDNIASPSLAESWSANDTADVWTFNLRQDVFFHDGTQLTSADVVYSVNHWKNELSTIAPVVSLIETVEATDDFTVVMTLGSGHADFPLLVMDYRARIIPDGGLEEVLTTGRGSGPFKLVTLDHEGTTTLVANDDYWGGKPGLAGIEVIAIPDQEATVQALLAGQIDWFDMTVQQAEVFQGNDAFSIKQIPTGNWTGFIMRTDTPPFDNVALRQAMRLVADRQAMVDLALSGAGTVSCDTPVMTGDPYKFTTDCSQNIDLAKEKMIEAGYPDGIDVQLYTSTGVCGDWVAVTEIYQQQAALVGIRVELIQSPADGFWSDVWRVEPFSMTCWGERTADQILNEAYRGGGSWNETYQDREDFDGLLDAARAELDFDARRELYLAAQQILWEEGGALIPYHNNIVRVTVACIGGIPDRNDFSINWQAVTMPADC